MINYTILYCELFIKKFIAFTFVENLLYANPSGAVHFIGNFAPA